MTSCVFGTAILFALNLVTFPCEGKITSPPDGTRMTFLPGSTEKIQWLFSLFDDAKYEERSWYFTSSDGSRTERLARIVNSNGKPRIYNSSLPGVAIETPATLVLKNIDLKNNGTYMFELRSIISELSKLVTYTFTSEVVVFVAVAPNVTFSCSSSVIGVNEGDNATCVCRGEGGNPPANVTWYKDGVQIGGTGKEEQTLTLRNVNRTDIGRYKCVAQSHIKATDEKSIEVKLNFKPRKIAITFTPEKVVVAGSANITCESSGFPEPSYTIFHNDTEVSDEKTHTISKVRWSDAGLYRCVAVNKLGSNSKSYCLTVVGETAASKKVDCESSAETVVVWHIVVTLVSGIIIGILFSNIVWCSRRRWFRNRKPERNRASQPTEADATYQELDLTKMNTEDNYQSLRMNATSNDEESTYTELKTARDEENNYQSLT